MWPSAIRVIDSYDSLVAAQIERTGSNGDLQALVSSGDTWQI